MPVGMPAQRYSLEGDCSGTRPGSRGGVLNIPPGNSDIMGATCPHRDIGFSNRISPQVPTCHVVAQAQSGRKSPERSSSIVAGI